MANNLEEETKLHLKNEKQQKLASSKQVEPIKDESKKDEEPSKWDSFISMLIHFAMGMALRFTDVSRSESHFKFANEHMGKLFSNKKNDALEANQKDKNAIETKRSEQDSHSAKKDLSKTNEKPLFKRMETAAKESDCRSNNKAENQKGNEQNKKDVGLNK